MSKEAKNDDFLIKNLFIIRTVKAITRGVFFLSNIDYNYKQLIVHLNHSSNDMRINVRLTEMRVKGNVSARVGIHEYSMFSVQ